jgi:hypothetical protein
VDFLFFLLHKYQNTKFWATPKVEDSWGRPSSPNSQIRNIFPPQKKEKRKSGHNPTHKTRQVFHGISIAEIEQAEIVHGRQQTILPTWKRKNLISRIPISTVWGK